MAANPFYNKAKLLLHFDGAAGDYGTFTATRQFGPVQIVVTNTASVQSVAVNDQTGSVLGGNYPGQGQRVIVSATAPANPVLNQLWAQT